MKILSNMLFFIMSFISGIISLFLLYRGVTNISNPFLTRKNEPYIVIFAGLFIVAGIAFSIHKAQITSKQIIGCGYLGLTWVFTIIILFVGLFFLNGPMRWN